ncbi:MAG: disulfide bond formation protein B [Cellvibrionaceae bacterium]
MSLPNTRITNLLIAITCIGLMAYALFSEMVLGLHPCPLCMTQRLFVILVGMIAFIAFIHNPAAIGRRVYAVLGIIAAALGAGVAGRHVWLQNLPEDQVPACGPSLDYILDTFPLTEAFVVLMRGDGNCADVVWQFLGLSMPTWVAISFAGLLLINLWQLLRRS